MNEFGKKYDSSPEGHERAYKEQVERDREEAIEIIRGNLEALAPYPDNKDVVVRQTFPNFPNTKAPWHTVRVGEARATFTRHLKRLEDDVDRKIDYHGEIQGSSYFVEPDEDPRRFKRMVFR